MRLSRALARTLIALLLPAIAACEDGGGDGAADGLTDAPADAAPDAHGDDGPGPDGDAADADARVDGADEGDGADAADGDVLPLPSPWEPSSLGDAGVLAGLHMVGPTEAYAVGGPRVLRWNGRTWAAFGEPTGDTLLDVWSDGEAVVVVGEGGLVARRVAPALAWTVEEAGVDVDLHGVDGRGPDDLWAVGDGATILRYAGPDAGWSVDHEGSPWDLRDVWVPGDGEGAEGVLAVGTGSRLFTGGDSAWTSESLAGAGVTLHAVLGVGDRRFAAGTDATLAVKDGAGWMPQSSNLDRDRDLYGLAGSSDAVFAFGEVGTVLRSDGDAWSRQEVAGPTWAAADLVVAGRAGSGEEAAWLVLGADGGGLRRADDGWVDMRTRPRDGLASLAGSSRDELWAAGPAGLLMARGGQGWTAVPVPTAEDLHDVAVAADGTVWAVGAAGTLLRRPSDGASVLLPAPGPAALLSVATDGERVVVGGKGGTVLRGPVDGSEVPAFWDVGTSSDVRAVGIGGDGAWWLAGQFGVLLRSADGEEVTPVASGVAGNLHDLAATDDGVLVVGDNGVVLEVSGGASPEVEQLHEQPGLFLFGVDAADGAALAVGWSGRVLRWTGEDFVAESGGTSGVLEAVWLDEDGALVVGRIGDILERTEAP